MVAITKIAVAGAARFALLAVALMVLGDVARAEPKAAPLPREPSASAMKIAREILDLKNSGYLFQPMVPGVIERVKSMLLQTNPALKKDLDDVAANLRKAYAPRFNELMTDIAWLYASRFTEAELKEIANFYRTALGKKVIELEPRIFDDAMLGLPKWQEKLSEEVIARFRAEMKKRGHDL
jgi:hypothetical protein